MLVLCRCYVGVMLTLCWCYVGVMLMLCWPYVDLMSGSIQSLISTIRDIVEIKKSRTWNKYKNHDSKTMGGQVLYAFPSLFPMTSTGFRKHIASSNSHFEYANTLPTPCQHLANTLPIRHQHLIGQSLHGRQVERRSSSLLFCDMLDCLLQFVIELVNSSFPPIPQGIYRRPAHL